MDELIDQINNRFQMIMDWSQHVVAQLEAITEALVIVAEGVDGANGAIELLETLLMPDVKES
jgi:ABC-type Na+ transport system ATPase subunit NatA